MEKLTKEVFKLFFVIAVIALSVVSCNREKEFEVNVPNSPALGLYCFFSPDSVWKTQIFELGSITDNIYDNSTLYVNDAEVSLYCNNEFQETLTNIGNGNYISLNNSKPEANKTYHIEAIKSGYSTIWSEPASLPPLILMDSVVLRDSLQSNFLSYYADTPKNDNDKQLDIFFKNSAELAILSPSAGYLLTSGYVGSYGCYKPIYPLLENEMNFLINTEALVAPVKISFVTNKFFEFNQTLSIQDDSQSGMISYYPGNIKSNISSGLGFFVGVNYTYIYLNK